MKLSGIGGVTQMVRLLRFFCLKEILHSIHECFAKGGNINEIESTDSWGLIIAGC
jgi:hypothetical protein